MLIICMKCADLSGLVMDLPRADFWGYRILMENLKQGGGRCASGWNRRRRRRGRCASQLLRAPGGVSGHIVLPMFDTLTLFTSGGSGRECWRWERELGRLAQRARGGDDNPREGSARRLTRHLLRCCAGFLMVVVFIISRGMLLQTMNEMAGDFRGSANPYAAQASTTSTSPLRLQVDRARLGFLAACCLALASPSVGARCSACSRGGHQHLPRGSDYRAVLDELLRYNTVKSIFARGCSTSWAIRSCASRRHSCTSTASA